MSELTYLDYAAATPLDERVLEAMRPFWTTQFYNPSALYEPAIEASKALNEARASVAHWLGARPGEIVFTAGGTEADNLAVQGIMRQFPDGNAVMSAIEHDAVRKPAALFDHRAAPVDEQGVINLNALAGCIDERTVLVSIMYANNEIGSVQPLREISALLAAERKRRGTAGRPIYLHTDACQAGNYLDLHAARLGVDMMTLNGGKLYGPKQSGVLFVKAGVELVPLILGGGQERGLRSGTQNVAGAIGMARALQIAQSERKIETDRLQKLQTLFFELVVQQLPHTIINGSRKKRLPNNMHVTLPGTDNERVLLQLEKHGILASAGSACSASDDTSSHVLLAMGLNDADARASLRFSMGRATDAAAIHRTVQALAAIG